MISIVCVYNNEDIFNNYLLKSLKNQTAEFELIAVDNTRNRFKSAAEALNYGGKKANGKYIMFVHQDINLSSNTKLEEIEKILDKLSNFGIAGVAGRKDGGKFVITNIKHGIPSRLAGDIQIDKPIKIQTLDECLIVIPKSVFKMLWFDERVCDDWHLYGVDYCLSVKKRGFDAYVIPTFIYHRSTGDIGLFRAILSLSSLPKKYYQVIGKVLKKHKNQVKKIYTTCGTWNTSQPLFWQRIVKLIMYILIKLRFPGYLYKKLGLKYLRKKFLINKK